MKVRVSFTIDIDADSWMLNYGIQKTEVRADVQEATKQNILTYYGGLGLLVSDT